MRVGELLATASVAAVAARLRQTARRRDRAADADGAQRTPAVRVGTVGRIVV